MRPKTNCQSFPYAAKKDARILILGSMPGVRSLQMRQYYAHPHNMFWPIMEELFGANLELDYPERLKRLTDSGVALWDVAHKCRRRGSLDSNIKMGSVQPNDFKTFFVAHPHIHTVLFNGQKAEQLFRRLVLSKYPSLAKRLRFIRLPSTSPAHASMTRAKKLSAWKDQVLQFL